MTRAQMQALLGVIRTYQAGGLRGRFEYYNAATPLLDELMRDEAASVLLAMIDDQATVAKGTDLYELMTLVTSWYGGELQQQKP